MTTIIKETVTSEDENQKNVVVNSPTKNQATNYQTNEYLIYFIFGILEALLVFRFIFKLTGASQNSLFVSVIYSITRFFIMPFEGIFRRFSSQGVETTSILEPSTLVALAVYALVAWGIVKLVRISSGEQQVE